ncbi:hypothetical protein ER308_07385 [Egibacter rhizosphaerae]|uniref:Type II secretion system protein GspF domain-containing protein n=1 Tax=Egibacter rhizosphaerae TaxID=1670831 RepID=A0A411YDV5_9ACTN|nr:type II secretion system F family protein [Egibacter rhizosphaerae]QBI19388.1 hypothetical protein ER308_07385 [Egibacter rhizosphaerae]
MARRDRAEPTTAELTAVRAALAAGAAPAAALAEATTSPGSGGQVALSGAASSARLGVPLAEAAERVPGDGAARLLVRALAVAERAGVGGVAAVDQVLGAVRDRSQLDRLLRVRTAQARVSARVLVLVPLGAWVLLTGLDPGSLGFYATPLGALAGVAAAALLATGWAWSARLVRRAATAGERADPLAPPVGRSRWGRGVAFATPVAFAGAALVGPLTGLAAGVGVAWGASRPVRADTPGARVGGGTAEACELVAIGLDAGLDPAGALDLTSDLVPPAAGPPLARAARRLRAGWSPAEAFEGGPLAPLGAVLDVGHRWGAGTAEPVRRLAADLRDERRAAAEEAVERVQVTLVFPTTLFTLPAFVLGVVPPVLWTAFGS